MAINPEQCKGMQAVAGLEYEQVEKFISFCGTENFAVGKVIFKQEDKNDGNFYLIIEGVVEVIKNTRKGEEVQARLKRGDLFGEMGVFTDHDRAATIRVAEAANCLVLTRAKYQQLRETEPVVALKFVENLLNVYFNRFRSVASKAETASFWL